MFGPSYEKVREKIVQRTNNTVVFYVNSTEQAFDLFNLENLSPFKLCKNGVMYCDCTKIII